MSLAGAARRSQVSHTVLPQTSSVVLPERFSRRVSMPPGTAAWSPLATTGVVQQPAMQFQGDLADIEPWLDAARSFPLNSDFDFANALDASGKRLDLYSLRKVMKAESAGKRTIQVLSDKLLLHGLLQNLGVPQMPLILAIRGDEDVTAPREAVSRLVEERISTEEDKEVVMKPTHLSGGTGVVIISKVTPEYRGATIDYLESHAKKFMKEKAHADESAALRSLRPGFIAQPKYQSVVGFKTPLELRVVTLWGKARLGVWWWGRAGQKGGENAGRNAWLVRRAAKQGELSGEDTWEVVHGHVGANPGFERGLELFWRHMPAMAATAEGVARAVGAPFLRCDFFVGCPRWGVRLNEVAYGCGADYRTSLRGTGTEDVKVEQAIMAPCGPPGSASAMVGGFRATVDDSEAVALILQEGMARCEFRMPPESFLSRLGVQGRSYADTVVLEKLPPPPLPERLLPRRRASPVARSREASLETEIGARRRAASLHNVVVRSYKGAASVNVPSMTPRARPPPPCVAACVLGAREAPRPEEKRDEREDDEAVAVPDALCKTLSGMAAFYWQLGDTAKALAAASGVPPPPSSGTGGGGGGVDAPKVRPAPPRFEERMGPLPSETPSLPPFELAPPAPLPSFKFARPRSVPRCQAVRQPSPSVIVVRHSSPQPRGGHHTPQHAQQKQKVNSFQPLTQLQTLVQTPQQAQQKQQVKAYQPLSQVQTQLKAQLQPQLQGQSQHQLQSQQGQAQAQAQAQLQTQQQVQPQVPTPLVPSPPPHQPQPSQQSPPQQQQQTLSQPQSQLQAQLHAQVQSQLQLPQTLVQSQALPQAQVQQAQQQSLSTAVLSPKKQQLQPQPQVQPQPRPQSPSVQPQPRQQSPSVQLRNSAVVSSRIAALSGGSMTLEADFFEQRNASEMKLGQAVSFHIASGTPVTTPQELRVFRQATRSALVSPGRRISRLARTPAPTRQSRQAMLFSPPSRCR